MSTKKTTKPQAKAAKKVPAKTLEPQAAETKVETPADAKPSKPAKEKVPGKLSALDAAAKVLAEAGQPMNAKALIEAMAAKKFWTSPGGKTPHATLFAALLREIKVKGTESRFAKVDRGQFALNDGKAVTPAKASAQKAKKAAKAAKSAAE